MKLTPAQILPLLFGAAEVSVDGERITAYKCTEKIRDNWGKLAPFLKLYASYTSGIRLDFETDGTEAVFSLSGGRFEAKVDGLTVCFGEFGAEAQDLRIALPEGNHRVTLLYPFLGDGRLCGVDLPDASWVRPHEYSEKFLFLGDSITQGCFAQADSQAFAWRVSEHFNADCIIHGVGGGYFHPSVFEAPEGFDPQRVFLAMGTNDFSWGFSLEELRANTVAYLRKVKEAYGTERVLCILPIWRGDSALATHGEDSFRRTVAMIREEEEKAGFSVLDGMTLVPHLPEYYSKDLLHPNGAGFAEYAKNLIRAL